MSQDCVKTYSIVKYDQGDKSSMTDLIVVEAPLEIRLLYRGKPMRVAITMRTPGDDEALALGFLITEGVISERKDITGVKEQTDRTILLALAKNVVLDENSIQRSTYMSSSCGICGKASLDAIRTQSNYLPWSDRTKMQSIDILQVKEVIKSHQTIFDKTGGNHAVALISIDGKLVHLSEDVGRHNAMDKLIGNRMMYDALPMDKHICLLSGRASYELIQKAMMAGVSIVVAVGAPSSLAIDLAAESGMTLLGFLKDHSFNIYTGAERIV